jgi:hypothetical protein
MPRVIVAATEIQNPAAEKSAAMHSASMATIVSKLATDKRGPRMNASGRACIRMIER